MILRLYTLLAVWTRLFVIGQDSDDIAKAILRDMSQMKKELQKKERTVVAKDVVSTVNELNFRIKSIYIEIQQIQKSTASEKNGPKSEILKTMYDDHVRMYQESAQSMNQLVDSYTENRLQVTTNNMAAFDETAWKNLLTKLEAAKVINQAFKYNHKLLHDSYSTIENANLSQETRNVYQFLYKTGDKCDKTGPKLIDPVSLQINDNARPEILHVEPKLIASTNIEQPAQPHLQQQQQPQMLQRQQDQQTQQLGHVNSSDESPFPLDQNREEIQTPDHLAYWAHHDHVHIVGNTKPELLHVDPSFMPHEPPASDKDEADRGI